MIRLLALLARIPGLGLLVAIPGANVVAAGATVVSSAASFFSTPIGKAVGAALIGAALFVAGDWHRAGVDREARAAEIAQADQARAARDAEIKKQASADAARRVADIQGQADALAKQVQDYEAALVARGGNACRATPDDARRLRGL